MDNFDVKMSDVNSIIKDLSSGYSEYEKSISDLKTVLSNIESSSGWVGNDLKGTFIKSAETHMKGFDTAKEDIEYLIKYLTEKLQDLENIESTFK